MFLRESLYQVSAEHHLEATKRLQKYGHELVELRCRGLPDEPYHPEKEELLEIRFHVAEMKWRVIDWITKRLDYVRQPPTEPV